MSGQVFTVATAQQEKEFLSRIAFSSVKGMNPTLGRKILERVVTPEAFFEMRQVDLSSALGFRNPILADGYRQELMTKAREELSYMAGKRIRLLFFTDEDYPRRLLECEDAPGLLYVSGDADLNAAHVVAVVGTRSATRYGVDFINKLVEDLSKRLDNLLIVSGLAVGCDITAHRAAMACGVPTVGVVAHGLDTLYPGTNRPYAAEMVKKGGAVVTEYPHATRPFRGNFLARNRIIAGLSDCVVVAESQAQKGGALNTAHIAGLYSREVFALPGRISDLYSGGCNELIRKNFASVITSAANLTDAMNWKCRVEDTEGVQKELFPSLTPDQQRAVDFLRKNGDTHINILNAQLGMPIGSLMAMMVDLDFAGIVCSLPGARYRLK